MSKVATKKAQVILSADEYALLREYAQQNRTTVSSVIRQNMQETLLATLEQRKREQALERLFSMNLPTDDWETIERQLEERWYGHEPT